MSRHGLGSESAHSRRNTPATLESGARGLGLRAGARTHEEAKAG
jgi:hypothetical protein